MKGANQLGTCTLEMTKICGNGTGTKGALYDLKNVPRGTKSIMEKSRGTESITEKSRGRGSAKCGEGRRANQGFFRTRTGTKRPFNVQNSQDEMAIKNRCQLLGMPRLWYIPTDLYEAHRPSAEITRSYLTTHNRQGRA